MIVPPSHASRIACRKVPGPLSALLVTVIEVAQTINVAVLDVSPVLPSVELTVEVVLFMLPGCASETLTEITHGLAVVTVAPDTLSKVELDVKPLVVGLPQLAVLRFGVAATCKPFVSVSVKATPVRVRVLAPGFVIVNVSCVAVFGPTVVGLKALLIVGGAATLSVAVLLVIPVPPSVELIAPVVFAASPAAVPFTSTLKVHDVL